MTVRDQSGISLRSVTFWGLESYLERQKLLSYSTLLSQNRSISPIAHLSISGCEGSLLFQSEVVALSQFRMEKPDEIVESGRPPVSSEVSLLFQIQQPDLSGCEEG